MLLFKLLYKINFIGSWKFTDNQPPCTAGVSAVLTTTYEANQALVVYISAIRYICQACTEKYSHGTGLNFLKPKLNNTV